MPALWWNFPMPWDYRWEGKKKKKTNSDYCIAYRESQIANYAK